ncbi:hypothetical protein A3A14_03280 [Candidatus Daviesbacteria bacterium RIFCSPLOWO2_01_FULL_43_38]|uniref:Uncharacterized protein n=1 Tax=Candidatus Daviesbacteria bacterium RIFCSPHIGHO2_12_FULL_43_11 TaxID=1797780 RepID=A0A1F5K219_9BACT|nr:MAG: hypothetical protein A2874_00160 [Candidatus Daviesbacteria bacterium RIFCSPHIGHO2_01_FULL_43_17]OGE34830.1 MAG: hypothetical protein A3E45_02545 [Candidatus Daviesbacteria bacterium RIFCSPHIGHO2_12_FULL_43_11]OGE63661.1 MAG: hypothetical protein A3A14_03280 [Candidatus Daviesbacteria bacterium RIFCSPLOWO2_01_FULL_43_38]
MNERGERSRGLATIVAERMDGIILKVPTYLEGLWDDLKVLWPKTPGNVAAAVALMAAGPALIAYGSLGRVPSLPTLGVACFALGALHLRYFRQQLHRR